MNEIAKQLEAIQAGMKAAETIAFPKISLRTYAVLVLIMPVIDGHIQTYSPEEATSSWWIRVVIYGGLFALARFILNHKFHAWQNHKAHPIAAQGILFQQRFTLLSALLMSYGFHSLGHPEFTLPVVLAHLAFLFSSFSRFSGSMLRWTAYLQCIFAFAYLICLKFYTSTELLPVFSGLLALSLLIGSINVRESE